VTPTWLSPGAIPTTGGLHLPRTGCRGSAPFKKKKTDAPCRAAPCRACRDMPGRAAPCRAAPCRASPCRARRAVRAVACRAVLRRAVPCRAAHVGTNKCVLFPVFLKLITKFKVRPHLRPPRRLTESTSVYTVDVAFAKQASARSLRATRRRRLRPGLHHAPTGRVLLRRFSPTTSATPFGSTGCRFSPQASPT
jgi:hypothetical protein